jgi:hypothetical protein
MSRRDSSAGGSAMQGGASYQNQAAAWLATKMLSEGSPDPIGPRGKVVYLAAETGAAVDDLLVGTEFADQRILNHLASSGGTQKTGQNPKFLQVDP